MPSLQHHPNKLPHPLIICKTTPQITAAALPIEHRTVSIQPFYLFHQLYHHFIFRILVKAINNFWENRLVSSIDEGLTSFLALLFFVCENLVVAYAFAECYDDGGYCEGRVSGGKELDEGGCRMWVVRGRRTEIGVLLV